MLTQGIEPVASQAKRGSHMISCLTLIPQGQQGEATHHVAVAGTVDLDPYTSTYEREGGKKQVGSGRELNR